MNALSYGSTTHRNCPSCRRLMIAPKFRSDVCLSCERRRALNAQQRQENERLKVARLLASASGQNLSMHSAARVAVAGQSAGETAVPAPR